MSRKPLCKVADYPELAKAMKDIDSMRDSYKSRFDWLESQTKTLAASAKEDNQRHWKKVEDILFEAGLLNSSFFDRKADNLHMDNNTGILSYEKASEASGSFDAKGLMEFLKAMASASEVTVTRVETSEKKPD